MSKSAYGYRTCKICGERISSAGAGWVSHGRMHVRKGEAKEYKDYNGRVNFYSIRKKVQQK